MSLEDVALRIGRTPETVMAYERGDVPIPISDFRALTTEIAMVSPSSMDRLDVRRPLTAPIQTDLFGEPPANEISARRQRSGAFTDNMSLPVHRWFRYSAGFSAEWAENLIKASCPPEGIVFDPFAGSGTTLLAAEASGVRSVGLEAHPFVARIAEVKLTRTANLEDYRSAVRSILDEAMKSSPPKVDDAPLLLTKCYDSVTLGTLLGLRRLIEQIEATDQTLRLLWLTLTAILRETSRVGTAQWQYVLPNKSKARVASPLDAFAMKAHEVAVDISSALGTQSNSKLLQADARTFADRDLLNSIDLVVTSPPYPNNYDYADATRLEMTFWGEISSWGDLHTAVRNRLICSCSQHSAAERIDLDALMEASVLDPIRDELYEACRALETIRETKGGKKTYHTMAASYFGGLGDVWRSLRKLMKKDSVAHFVIGDSAPYGIHLPCDRWLGELAIAAGFRSFSFEKLRDRNTKWKNRKHRVPLKEGILTVVG